MLPELFLVWVLRSMSFLLELFPEDEVAWPDATWLPAFIGPYVGPFDTIGPFSESAAALILLVTTVLPAVIIVRVSLWVWFLLPVVK